MILFILALVASFALSNRLEVISPGKLSNEFGGNDIKFEVANFGKIAYGRSMTGDIYFQRTNSKGCKPFDPLPQDLGQILFVLVERGDCTFVQKARNIQNAGGKLAMVYDNKSEDIASFIMVDDGTGSDIFIPLIMIQEEDGEALKYFLSKNHNEHTTMKVDFQFQSHRGRANVKLFFSSDDDTIRDFLTEFKPFFDLISNRVDFEPHFYTFSCPKCTIEFRNANCYSDGNFCAFSDHFTGHDVLNEDLRQICINQKYDVRKWFKYVQAVKGCSYNNPGCFKDKTNEVNVDQRKIQNCVKASFINPKNKEESENTLLELERFHWTLFSNHISPSLTIDDWQYRGNFDAYDVFVSICSSFTEPPDSCKESPASTSKSNLGKVFGICFLVLFLVIVNVVIIYCYRRQSKREMHDKLHHEVNSAVSAYFALSEGGPGADSLKD